MAQPPLPFTLLTEESTNTTMALPGGFDPMTAWLLAQCSTPTYQQYDTATPPDLSSLTLTGATITSGTPQLLTVSEANGPDASPNFPGSYTTLPVGFVVAISQSGVSSKSSLPPQFIVVTLRGTQTWDEWMDDAEAFPDFYGNTGGLVHSGIYGMYTVGTLSVLSVPTGSFLHPYQTNVPNSFRIVHACDIIPILPGTTVISNSLLAIDAAQVTDPYTYVGQQYPGLPGNVVSFCAQTGDIGGNHSCLNIYLPYTTWLAAAWLGE